MRQTSYEKFKNYFEIGTQESNLKKLAIRGGIATGIGQVSQQALKLFFTVIIARLLSPNDYGLIAMITTVTGFVILFKDLGLSMATVQRETISHYEVSNLFWLNILFSITVWLIILAMAPFIAWFYNKPELLVLTLALSTGFVLSGLSMQHQAILKRKMMFSKLIVIEIGAQTLSVITGVILAASGAGVWALVFMELTRSASNVIITWCYCTWRPSLPQRNISVKSMLKFGANYTGANILSYFNYQLPFVLIGKFWGADSLGIFDKAYQLMLYPVRQLNQPFGSVAIPTLSRLQNDPVKYKKYYESAILLLSYISMPPIAYLVVMAKSIILFLLGARWDGASELFAVLGLYGIFIPVLNTSMWLFVSTGKSKEMMCWQLFDGIATIMAVVIGISFGTKGVVVCWVSIKLILMFPSLLYAARGTPVTLKGICVICLVPFLSVLISSILLFFFKNHFLQEVTVSMGILISVVFYSLIFTILDCILSRSFYPFKKLVELYRIIKAQ